MEQDLMNKKRGRRGESLSVLKTVLYDVQYFTTGRFRAFLSPKKCEPMLLLIFSFDANLPLLRQNHIFS